MTESPEPRRIHVIYIPGLGKIRPPVQDLLVKLWPLWGVESELFLADWSGPETWDGKLERLLGRIDEATSQGKTVGLVSASAGASAALNAYAARKDTICGVVLIAGMVNRPEDIWERYRRRNPSFVASANAVKQSLEQLSDEDLGRVLSAYGILDEIVAPKYSRITGASNKRLPAVGHVLTIAAGLSVWAPFMLRFLKRRVKAL